MYLLDTSVCIDFLSARNANVVARMDAAFGRLAISALTFAELAVGGGRSTDPVNDARRLDTFAQGVDILPFDKSTALAYGLAVRTIGVRRKSFDRLIAAQAIAHTLVLVTNNEADFTDVPGLKIENWTL